MLLFMDNAGSLKHVIRPDRLKIDWHKMYKINVIEKRKKLQSWNRLSRYTTFIDSSFIT